MGKWSIVILLFVLALPLVTADYTMYLGPYEKRADALQSNQCRCLNPNTVPSACEIWPNDDGQRYIFTGNTGYDPGEHRWFLKVDCAGGEDYTQTAWQPYLAHLINDPLECSFPSETLDLCTQVGTDNQNNPCYRDFAEGDLCLRPEVAGDFRCFNDQVTQPSCPPDPATQVGAYDASTETCYFSDLRGKGADVNRAYCQQYGGSMFYPNTEQENIWVWENVRQITGPTHLEIGATDRWAEGWWLTDDGTNDIHVVPTATYCSRERCFCTYPWGGTYDVNCGYPWCNSYGFGGTPAQRQCLETALYYPAGRSPQPFSFWAGGEPNNDGREDWLETYYFGGRWNDRDHGGNWQSICEVPMKTSFGTCRPCDGVEICDGIDNDCDGFIDNAVPGQGSPLNQSCGSGMSVGACVGGFQTCNAQPGSGVESWSTCVEPVPSAEICDGIDNDCDGSTDEGLLYSTDTFNCAPASQTLFFFQNGDAAFQQCGLQTESPYTLESDDGFTTYDVPVEVPPPGSVTALTYGGGFVNVTSNDLDYYPSLSSFTCAPPTGAEGFDNGVLFTDQDIRMPFGENANALPHLYLYNRANGLQTEFALRIGTDPTSAGLCPLYFESFEEGIRGTHAGNPVLGTVQTVPNADGRALEMSIDGVAAPTNVNANFNDWLNFYQIGKLSGVTNEETVEFQYYLKDFSPAHLSRIALVLSDSWNYGARGLIQIQIEHAADNPSGMNLQFTDVGPLPGDVFLNNIPFHTHGALQIRRLVDNNGNQLYTGYYRHGNSFDTMSNWISVGSITDSRLLTHAEAQIRAVDHNVRNPTFFGPGNNIAVEIDNILIVNAENDMCALHNAPLGTGWQQQNKLALSATDNQICWYTDTDGSGTNRHTIGYATSPGVCPASGSYDRVQYIDTFDLPNTIEDASQAMCMYRQLSVTQQTLPAAQDGDSCYVFNNHLCLPTQSVWSNDPQQVLSNGVFFDRPANELTKYSTAPGHTPDNPRAQCCPQSYCYNPNVGACVDGSATLSPNLFYEYQDTAYVCTNGVWNQTSFSVSPFSGERGACVEDTSCFYSRAGAPGFEPNMCVPNGTQIGAYACRQGTWSSSVKPLALGMVEAYVDQAANIGGDANEFALYCGNIRETLNYISDELGTDGLSDFDKLKGFNNSGSLCDQTSLLFQEDCAFRACTLHYDYTGDTRPNSHRAILGVSSGFIDPRSRGEAEVLLFDALGIVGCAQTGDVWEECSVADPELNGLWYYNSGAELFMYVPTESVSFLNGIENLIDTWIVDPLYDAWQLLLTGGVTGFDASAYTFLEQEGLYDTLYLARFGSNTVEGTVDRRVVGDAAGPFTRQVVLVEYVTPNAQELCANVAQFNNQQGIPDVYTCTLTPDGAVIAGEGFRAVNNWQFLTSLLRPRN